MKIFKEIIGIINRTIVSCGFGFGAATLFNGKYELASWVLFGASILFMVGYISKRWSK